MYLEHSVPHLACITPGATTGGFRGALTAMKTKPEHGIDTNRLKVNRFLNLSGR